MPSTSRTYPRAEATVQVSVRRGRRLEHRRGVAALVVLWVSILALGFAAQATELFGSHRGMVPWLLLAAAALGFMFTGVIGARLIQRALDQDETRSSRPAADRSSR